MIKLQAVVSRVLPGLEFATWCEPMTASASPEALHSGPFSYVQCVVLPQTTSWQKRGKCSCSRSSCVFINYIADEKWEEATSSLPPPTTATTTVIKDHRLRLLPWSLNYFDGLFQYTTTVSQHYLQWHRRKDLIPGFEAKICSHGISCRITILT